MKKLHSSIDDNLLQRTQLLDRMTASVRARLPQHLAEHCWVGNYDARCLNLITDDVAFTTPIYYQQQEIVKQVNEEFGGELCCHFKKATVRVLRYPIPHITK